MGHTFETLYCRCFQAALKLGNYFMGYRIPHYLEGEGAASRLGEFLREKGLGDVLVVTGSGMVRRGQAPSLPWAAAAVSIAPRTFAGVPQTYRVSRPTIRHFVDMRLRTHSAFARSFPTKNTCNPLGGVVN